MKVLLVSTRSSGGGAALAAKQLHFSLQEQGIDSRLFVLHKEENETGGFEYAQQNKYGLFRKYLRKLLGRWHQWLTSCNTNQRTQESFEENGYTLYLGNIRSLYSLKDILLREDYDVLHLHWVDGFLDVKDLRYVTKPIVWTLHDCSVFTGGCPHPYQCLGYKKGCDITKDCPMVGTRWFRSFIIQNVRCKKNIFSTKVINFVVPSHWMLQKAHESALLNHCNISVIPNCINTSLFAPMDKETAKAYWGLSGQKRYIVYGAMNALTDRNKGFDILQQVFRMYSFAENIELLIFGAEQMNNIDFGIPVTSLGVVPPHVMPYVYNAAEVTLVPSRCENLPGVAIESISCGIPVVGFNVGGIPDIIHHQCNGYLANAYDVQDFAQGIQWCLNRESSEWSAAIARSANISFSMPNVANQHINLYKNILNL